MDDGWCEGTLNGEKGWFPGIYTKLRPPASKISKKLASPSGLSVVGKALVLKDFNISHDPDNYFLKLTRGKVRWDYPTRVVLNDMYMYSRASMLPTEAMPPYVLEHLCECTIGVVECSLLLRRNNAWGILMRPHIVYKKYI